MKNQFIGIILTGIVAIFVIQYLIRHGLGIGRPKTKTEKEIDEIADQSDKERLEKISLIRKIQSVLNNSGWFNPTLWKQAAFSRRIPDATARILAKDIHDSFSFWGDNETKIYATFNKIDDKIQVSQIAYQYADLYDSDLLRTLFRKLDLEELYNIYAIIKNK